MSELLSPTFTKVLASSCDANWAGLTLCTPIAYRALANSKYACKRDATSSTQNMTFRISCHAKSQEMLHTSFKRV